jgi:hypothetical protein
MKKNMIEAYALTACFAAVIFLVVSGAICLYQFLRVIEPSVTVDSYTRERGISDEVYLQTWPEKVPKPEPSAVPRLRLEAFERALRAERHSGLDALLQSLMFAIAAALVFWLHWRLAQREHAIEGRLLADSTPG